MSKNEFDVVAVGNAIVDLVARCDENFIEEAGMTKGVMQLVFSEEDALSLYSKLPPCRKSSGGSAANTIAALAELGGKAGFIGKVSKDDLGQDFIDGMKSCGIHFKTKSLEQGPATGRCMIVVTPDGDRTMNTYLGASVEFSEEDIDEDLLSKAKVVYLEGYLFDRDTAKRAFARAAEIARKAGSKVALTLSDPFCVERHREDLLELVQNHVDILFANRDEAKALFQTDNIEDCLKKLEKSVEIVAVTMSEKGSIILTGGQRYEIPAYETKVVDTTGAGDLYAGGFLYGYTQGYDFERTGRIAAACAAEIISHLGARSEGNLSDFVERLIQQYERRTA